MESKNGFQYLIKESFGMMAVYKKFPDFITVVGSFLGAVQLKKQQHPTIKVRYSIKLKALCCFDSKAF